MTTVDRVKVLCKERGIPISVLEKRLGFSNAYFSGLKKGSLPDDRLKKVADYFDKSRIPNILWLNLDIKKDR